MTHLAGVCVCNDNESVSLVIRTVHSGLYVMVFPRAPAFLNVYLLTVWFYSSEKVNWIQFGVGCCNTALMKKHRGISRQYIRQAVEIRMKITDIFPLFFSYLFSSSQVSS